MYLELKKKLREYKASESYKLEAEKVTRVNPIWDYDISLPRDAYPLSAYLAKKLEARRDQDNTEYLAEDVPDPFSAECYGDRGILASILSADNVDGDWLNGVILAREIVSDLAFNKFSVSISTWHSGCDTGLIHGFNHFCSASQYSGRKKIQWDWTGVDIKADSKNAYHSARLSNAIIGAVGTSDITLGSNIVNSAHVVRDKWPEGVDIVFHDIYPKNPQTLLSGVLLSMMILTPPGRLVCRLPDLDNWSSAITEIMIMIAMLFKNVKLWHPMWGRSCGSQRRKTYIIAWDKKKTVHKPAHKNLLLLLRKDLDQHHVLKRSLYSDDLIKDWINVCQNIKRELIECPPQLESPVESWVELMNTTLNSIPNTKKISRRVQ